ncbi:hypothetical protein Tco_0793400 [Tanacetum coccineum]
MDSIISLGQKNTLAEYMILSGADNRPPMLDKDLYDSWKSRMELYMQNREHGRMILESVEHGPLIWPTVEENGVIRTKKYAELSAAEKIQADCDMKATNIILQGLPVDIYSLVNHHRVAKDLWERVQLLMQGYCLLQGEANGSKIILVLLIRAMLPVQGEILQVDRQEFLDATTAKVMQAYYAKESPIPSPTIMPPSSMRSPMFNPQEFFLPEELLPLKKRGRDQSSSSTSALPQAFKIGENSRKTSLERHEDQIEEILNQLDELSLDRIEHIETISRTSWKRMPQRMSTSEAPAMTQAAIKKLVADSFERTESVFSRSNCTEDYKVKFATGTLTEEALSWWNSFAQPIGIEEAYKITWGNDLKAYVRRFQELATLCPTMVPDSEKMMEVFIGGLPQSIEGNVTASKPQTLEEAINIAQRLMDQCRKTTNNNAQGRAYMLRDRNAHQDPNIVTGMFLLNQHLARVLFDSGADKSFVSISLASKLNIPPITIDTFYDIEMADGNLGLVVPFTGTSQSRQHGKSESDSYYLSD